MIICRSGRPKAESDRKKIVEQRNLYSFSSVKACWVHQSLRKPNQIFAAPKSNREQRDYYKSDPGEDYYYVGCLGLTSVFAT